MKKYKYKYCIPGKSEDLIEFESNWDDDYMEWVAEDAVKYEYDFEPDIIEKSLPMIFIIYDMNNNELGKYKVDFDYFDPIFFAQKMEQ